MIPSVFTRYRRIDKDDHDDNDMVAMIMRKTIKIIFCCGIFRIYRLIIWIL